MNPNGTITLALDEGPVDGMPYQSPYLLAAWLPLAGPSVVALMQTARMHVPRGEVAVVELSSMLGLGVPNGQRSKVFDTIGRAARFHLLRWHPEHGLLTLPRLVPLLTPANRERLVERLGVAGLERVERLERREPGWLQA